MHALALDPDEDQENDRGRRLALPVTTTNVFKIVHTHVPVKTYLDF